ncbi:flagellar export chaperone FlgN [Buchnera aphidicola]|uniref:flagellar export chaperone FlgN n=1 Tax=Buchnera aphidicola TaxID=9 RepID=UPI003463D6CA
MKKLINTIKEIGMILISLEKLIKKENKYLISSEINIKKIELITKEKEFFLKKLAFLTKIKVLLEKKYNVFFPYSGHDELNYRWNKILSICSFLKKKNQDNKRILNQKFYLNERFLSILKKNHADKKNSIYNIDGNLES